jgi:anti-sigma regulatory factor (Ser/Thr protein kinase)
VRITHRGFGYNGHMTSPDPPTNAPGRLTGVPEVVTVDQPFEEDGLYSLRAAVAAHAGSLGADPALVDQLLIVASELATNAIRHGGGAGRLRLWRDQTLLHLQISDHGRGFTDPTVGAKPPDQMSTGGRGMWICRQLVPDLRIDTGPDGTTVTAIVSLDGHAPDPDTGDRAPTA